MFRQDRIRARTSELFIRITPMIKVIETAFSIEKVFYALGLTSIILVGVIVVLIYKTR